MAMSDEEMAKLLSGEPPAAKATAPPSGGPMTDEQFAAVMAGQSAPLEAQSYLGGILDHAAKGATFGFSKDAEAFLTPDVQGSGHKAKRGEIDDRQERFRKTNPITAGVSEVGGMIAGSLVPVGWLGRLGALGRAASSVLPNANIARSVGQATTAPFVPSMVAHVAPKFADGAFHQLGIAGVKAEALSAMGNRDADKEFKDGARDVVDPREAAKAYGLGGALGWGGNKLVEKATPVVSDIMGKIRAARTEGLDAITGSERSVLRSLDSDKLPDLQRLKTSVLPAHKTMAEPQIEDIVTNYGRRIANGESDLVARQGVVTDIMARRQNANALVPGTPQHALAHADVVDGTVEKRVREIVGRYDSKNQIPAQLHELVAQATGGEAKNTFGQYRYGANAPSSGTAANDAVQFTRTRQNEQGGKLKDIFQRRLGDGDVEAAIIEAENRIGASNDLYKPILQRFQDTQVGPHFQKAIQRAMDETNAKLRGRQDEIADAAFGQANKFRQRVVQQGTERATPILDETGAPIMRRGLDDAQGNPFYSPAERFSKSPDFKVEPAMDSLEAFIGQRHALEDAIKKAYRAGDNNMGAELKALKDRFNTHVRGMATDETLPAPVRQVMGDWVNANDTAAGAHALRRAYESGLSTPLKITSGKSAIEQQKVLRQFENMNPERQQLYSRGIMTQIKAQIEGAGDLHDLSKFFSNQQSRTFLSRVLGEDAAEEIRQHVTRVALGTRSFNANKGSQTAPMMLFNKNVQPLIDLASNLNPMNILQKVGKIGSEHLLDRRVEEVMKILGANTDNPHELMATINRLAAARAQMQQNANAQLPTTARRAVPATTTAADERANRKYRY